MKMKTIENIKVAIATALAATIITGCGTTAGYKRADKTGAGIAEFREEVTRAGAAVNDTVRTLDDVAATADTNPRKAFEAFSKSVTQLDAAATKAKKSGQDIQEQGQAYFKQWEQQMAQVKNPEIRNLATQRRAKLQATFDNIKKYTEPLKAQFDPWMSDLKDLRTYLSNDLTVTGVDTAKSLFAKTQAGGMEVQKSMDFLVAELNTIAATLTPANVKAR